MSEIIDKMPNIFLCGLSGSGKDKFVTELIKQAPYYLKIRTAETIKRLVTEVNNLSFDELEVLKRTDKKLRSQHNEFDNMMRGYTDNPDQISSANRYRMIINRKTMDFTNPVVSGIEEKLLNNPICVFDGRDALASQTFIMGGFIGIFLTRTNNEFRNKNHETETDNIANGTIENLCSLGLASRIIIINNDDTLRPDIDALKLKFTALRVYNVGRIESETYARFLTEFIGDMLEEFTDKINNGANLR